MNATEIANLRLHNQRIATGHFSQPEEVVKWMGAMQAQDYQQALWAVGLRTADAQRADVEQAIASRKIVLTWPMRGTMHLVPAENVKWMLELLAPRQLAADQLRLKQLELDDQILAQCRDLFEKALSGGRPLTRSALMQLLENAGIDTQAQRGYHILWHMAQKGLICLGTMQEKEQTFVLLEEWIPQFPKLSREEALASLAGGYFASHGPASLPDFAGWAGITLSDARTGLESVKAKLVAIQNGSKEYWLTQESADLHIPATSDTYLLPGFDEYLLGYKDRSDVLAVEHARKIVPGGNGIFQPTLVSNGQVVGTWKRSFGKKAVDVTLIPFEKVDDSAPSLTKALQRFSAFIGLPLSLKAFAT
jgi:hypothetical protein